MQEASLEKHIRENASPAYIVHTVSDKVVNVKNSLAFVNAYTEVGVPYELHIYPDAPHGIALGNKITKCGVDKWENASIAKWIENAVFWAENV